jgi:cysteine-rich repeat protein
MDGLKDASEECDDGNAFNNDGCSTLCIIEDPAEDTWICTTIDAAKSSCCAKLVHPISQVRQINQISHALIPNPERISIY